MQFSNFMPLFCATAICAGSICARADDTPAQAAARAALEQKMSELDAQDASTNSGAPPIVVTATPSVPATPTPAESVAIAPATTSQPIVVVPVTASADTEMQTAARAALEAKMRELDENQSATNAITAEPAATIPSVAAPVQTPAATTTTSRTDNSGKASDFKPIEAPPLPISAEKQAQLQVLLAKYMADQVTPEEYHAQRAAIIAAP